MSMMSWTERGYGYPLYENIDKVKEFLITNGKFDEDQKTKIQNCEDEFALEEITDQPAAWTVADIINELEGIIYVKGYQCCGDTDQEAMLGITPMYPWDMDMPFTLFDANILLEKYAKQLGITVKPDYFDANYYG